MPIDPVTQLEQALAAARELIADWQRRYEAAEASWAAADRRQKKRIAWLEDRISSEIVGVSKQGTP